MAKVDEWNSETLVRGVPWVLQENLVGFAVLGTQGLQDFKDYMYGLARGKFLTVRAKPRPLDIRLISGDAHGILFRGRMRSLVFGHRRVRTP